MSIQNAGDVIPEDVDKLTFTRLGKPQQSDDSVHWYCDIVLSVSKHLHIRLGKYQHKFESEFLCLPVAIDVLSRLLCTWNLFLDGD